MMVRSLTRMVRPSFLAALTSSSQTNATGVAGGGGGAGVPGVSVEPGQATEAASGRLTPREARN